MRKSTKVKGGRLRYQTLYYRPSDEYKPPLPPRDPKPEVTPPPPPPPPPPAPPPKDESSSTDDFLLPPHLRIKPRTFKPPPRLMSPPDREAIQEALSRLRKTTKETKQPVENLIEQALQSRRQSLQHADTVETSVADLLGMKLRGGRLRRKGFQDWLGGYVIIPKQRRHPFLIKGSKQAKVYMALVRSFKK